TTEQRTHPSSNLAAKLSTWCCEQLENATFATAPALVELMSVVVSTWDTESSSIPVDEIDSAITAALEILSENWTNSRYFPRLFNALVDFAFQPALLGSKELLEMGERSPLKKWKKRFDVFVFQVLSTTLKWSDIRFGLFPRITALCVGYWRQGVGRDVQNKAALSSLAAHNDDLIEMLLYGPVRDQNKDEHKLEAAVALKLTTEAPLVDEEDRLSEEVVAEIKETAEWNFSQRDYIVRVYANNLLARLDIQNDPTQRSIAIGILQRLVELHASGAFVAKFTSTLEHRKQVRLWCSVHLILHSLQTSQEALVFVDLLIRSIDLEQIVTTRYFIEWALVRVVSMFPSVMDMFWTHLTHHDRRAHTVTSLISVTAHAGEHIRDQGDQRRFYGNLFKHALMWVTSNHFTIRVFAHYAVLRGWMFCKGQSHLSSIPASLTQLQPLMEYIINNPECRKHREKCEQTYFLGGGFHPIRDVNLDFIFRYAMKVGVIAEAERISPTAFEKLESDAGAGLFIPLRLQNVTDFSYQDQAISDQQVHKGTGGQEANATSNGDDDATEDVSKGDAGGEMALQKKIIPWEAMMETDIDLFREREDFAKKQRNPLIVVASLITKAPNLGGLCRTCEIFNAEMLVVNNLKIKDDLVFQSLCVTADRWMPMKEVKEVDLMEFLQEKKEEGYALVGIEQATNSVSLESFHFPKKCVLLLGKEREGIPVRYLPLLDHVLEIPQYGLIRSLNVHVSGALIIWEYTKQRYAV
ncbi:Tar (HIV-1) RNA binding protein 1, partial [Quaeritorhiza haematococci]